MKNRKGNRLRTLKNRMLALLITMSMVASLVSAIAPPSTAKAETSGDYEYTVNQFGRAEITKYIGSGGNLVIPETFGDTIVSTIASSAFKDCTSITGIVVLDNITSISSNAFAGCTQLTDVTIGDKVVTISSSAFSGCTNLTNVTLGSAVQSISP
ncbi:MAG: leucine-rich repeat domain-containing protein, partial [Lachnoclostridium sp.]|nr:leucine-rich repeat domain-containing protein [Lachnoclostridium sp.]